MVKALFTKGLGDKLIPADADARQMMEDFRPGRGVWVELTKPQRRNERRHRLFWALVKIVKDNTDTGHSEQAIAAYLKVRGGHVEVFRRKGGEIVEIPKSIAWSKCTEGEFREFLDRLMDVVRQEIIPGLAEGDLRRELEEISGMKVEGS